MLSPFDSLPFTTYSWFIFSGAAISFSLFFYSLLQRTSHVGFWYSYLCLGETVYTFGYGMELACKTVTQTHFWLTFEMVGGAYLPGLVILMAYTYRYHTKAPLWLTTLLLTISSATIAIQFGNENHRLIFKSVELALHEGMSVSLLEFGPWFYVHMVYANIAMTVSTCLFYQCWKDAPKKHRHQVFLILLGSLPPWIFYLIYLFNWAPYGLDLSAFGFLLTGPMYAYSLFRYRFADLLPVAQAQVLDNIDEGVIVLDTQWRVIDSNIRARQLFPVIQDGNENCPPQLQMQLQQDSLSDGNSTQWLHHHQREYEIQCQPLRNDSVTVLGYVLMIRDVTERMQQLTQLQNQAEFDDLTGILNRRMILLKLEHSVQQIWCSSRQEPFGLILFDIDCFKRINDMQGHQVGDLMLKQLASLLQQQMYINEQFGRYGGDEFLILVTGMSHAVLRERAEQLRSLASRQLGITLSMGLTHYLPHDTPRLMLQRADHALYQAKSAGRNRICAMQEQLDERISVIGLR